MFKRTILLKNIHNRKKFVTLLNRYQVSQPMYLNNRIMKKTTVMVIILALGCVVSLAQNETTEPQDNACDSLMTDNRKWKERDSVSCKSVVINNTGATRMQKECARMVKYDAFKEKMKEPWLGGQIKDIVSK